MDLMTSWLLSIVGLKTLKACVNRSSGGKSSSSHSVPFFLRASVKSIVCHGETGFLIDLDDVEEMAKYVMELYHNEKMRRTIVAHAQENIEKFEITSVLKEEERIIVSNL